ERERKSERERERTAYEQNKRRRFINTVDHVRDEPSWCQKLVSTGRFFADSCIHR
ncbi:MAG: hypothetical protein ACI8RD_012790, partial [Bacillariaceae sp.]